MEKCRLCLKRQADSIDVLDNSELVSKVKECVSVEINLATNYPRHICHDCLKEVENWYSFKIMCLNSQRLLDEQEPSDIKFDIDEFTEIDCPSPEHKSKPVLHSCDFCPETFEYYIDYLDHQYIHDGEAMLHCEKCELTFSCRDDLISHERKHKISCEICEITIQKQSLRLHLIKHTDRFKCDHCFLTFTSGASLQEHLSAVHMKLKQHFCETCGKDFPSKSSLALHLKIHSDEKKYKCDKCDYAAKTSVSLRIHKSKHENGTYICEHCSKIFKSVRNLRDHLKRVHHSVKKFTCDFCDMKFGLRYLLEQHKRTHTGIRPFECTKCPKTFARLDSLKEHLNIHDRRLIFNCTICLKPFKTKRGVKRHICMTL